MRSNELAEFLSFRAGAALNDGRLVRVSAENTVVQCSAATDVPIGIVQVGQAGRATVVGQPAGVVLPSAPGAQTVATGELADVAFRGVAYAQAGGNVSPGDRVRSDASGRVVNAAPAAGVNNGVIGIALEPGVTDSFIRIMITQFVLQG